MKIVFFGTPEFAKEFLVALHSDKDFEIAAIVAQPDKEVGRKMVLTPPPTKVFAENNNIPVLQPHDLKSDDFVQKLNAFDPDVFVVVAYGRIIPLHILELAKHGAINVHPSLLPKYRGPSPLQTAILHGETKTGVTIMLMDQRMDHGPILKQAEIDLASDETPQTLMQKVVCIGAPMLADVIKDYVSGKLEPQEQDDDVATFCQLIKREHGEIDFQKSAEEIERMSRAFDPWPGIYMIWEDGSRLKIHELDITDNKMKPGEMKKEDGRLIIGTKTNAIELIEVQPENKSRMSADAFLNGLK